MYVHVEKQRFAMTLPEKVGPPKMVQVLKFSEKWHFWGIISSNTNIGNHWKHYCVLSMYQPMTSMNFSSLGITLLEISVPKLGQSNCGKVKKRLFLPFWPAITSQNNIGTVSYYICLFYGIVSLGNCNYMMVGCTLPEEWDLKIAENATFPHIQRFSKRRKFVNIHQILQNLSGYDFSMIAYTWKYFGNFLSRSSNSLRWFDTEWPSMLRKSLVQIPFTGCQKCYISGIASCTEHPFYLNT